MAVAAAVVVAGALGCALGSGGLEIQYSGLPLSRWAFFAPEADAAVLLPLTALNVFLILFSLLLLVAELRAPLGVYGVIGNHDYPSGYQAWLRFLRSCDIRMLVNEHAPPGDALTMAGVNDPMAEWNHEEAPNLPKALAGAPADRPVVLLAHEPVSLWAGMPVRLFCPAEITLITLRPRPGRAKL